MKHSLSRALLSFGALITLGGLVSAQENYTTWSHHRDVFLNTTATSGGANVTANVTGFPVLVRLTARDSATFKQALAGGADLRFTKTGDVVRLKHQIEAWDTASRSAAIWVLVDTVYGNNKTQKLRMHWGKAGAADSSRGAQVFTTAGGFFNVWHLGDAAGVTARPSAVTGGDSALPNNFDAAYTARKGVIGKADSLRGGLPPETSDRLILGSGAGYSSWATGFTFSVWAKPTTVANHAPFFSSSNGYAVAANDIIMAGRQAETEFLKFRMRTGSGAYSGINDVGQIALDQWQHFVFTRPGNTGTARVFHNGVEIVGSAGAETMAAFAETPRPNNYLGGSFSPNDNNYAGLLDEARLAKVARSADWIKLEYENQKPEGGLAFFDSANAPPPAPPTLAYAQATITLNTGASITAITPVLGGGRVDSITVSPALPNGLTLNKTTGVITGAPAAASSATAYVFTAVNAGGSAKDTINVTVTTSLLGGAAPREGFSIRSTAAGVSFVLPEGAGRALLSLTDVQGRRAWSREANLGQSVALSRSALPFGVYSATLEILEGADAGRSFGKSFSHAP